MGELRTHSVEKLRKLCSRRANSERVRHPREWTGRLKCGGGTARELVRKNQLERFISVNGTRGSDEASVLNVCQSVEQPRAEIINADPEIGRTLFEILETQHLLASDAQITLIPQGSRQDFLTQQVVAAQLTQVSSS